MVNKKKKQKNRDYCRSFCQKKGDLYKTNNSTTKKNWNRKKKISRTKKVRRIQEERSCRVREYS